MSKRQRDSVEYGNVYEKRIKLNKNNSHFIRISINDSLFYQYSLTELSDFSKELDDMINKLQVYKERIDSTLAIYS
tara:strand:- start:76 stop:303 length:228 start_codon:yes stop_codon:yes gene_type:complete